MYSIDMSQIDFSNLTFPRITQKFKTVSQLYRACQYEEAEALAKTLTGYEPQLADMRAQTAFFRSDFQTCIQQTLLFYPYLDEWYSGNKRSETQKMLVFALQKTDADIRQDAIGILMKMHHHFSDEQLEQREMAHFKAIPQLIAQASDSLGQCSNRDANYTPPDTPKELSDVLDDFLECNKKRLAKLQGDPLDDAQIVSKLLVTVIDQCRPEDYLYLYEKHLCSPVLQYAHFRAAKIYLYLNQPEKASEALINYARYGFWPVEWSDVRPMAIVDCPFLPLLTKDLLDRIYRIPFTRDI